MAPKITVGYWDARGRAGAIRLLLKYAGVDFEDKRYKPNPEDRSKAEWFQVKHTLGFDFPNLPYLIDGDVKLTQSLAISRYLGRKYHLDGTNEVEKNRLALLEQQIADLVQAFVTIVFIKGATATPEEKAEFVKQLETVQFPALEKFLGNAKYASGSDDHLSYVDFNLYEYLYWINTSEVAKGVVDKFAHLKAFQARIEGLPQIEAYLKEVNSQTPN